MKSYSPVDNVEHQDYPHLLMTAGYHDAKLGYWEPAKYAGLCRCRYLASVSVAVCSESARLQHQFKYRNLQVRHGRGEFLKPFAALAL